MLGWDYTARPDVPGWYATLTPSALGITPGARYWTGETWAPPPAPIACSDIHFASETFAMVWAADHEEDAQ